MLSYIEISKENLLHNFSAIKSLVKNNVKTVAVIKANAYGHGQNEVAQILEDVADYFQVDDLQELELLRKVSKKSTLVLGYVAKDEMKRALELEGILGVYDCKQIDFLNSIAAENDVIAKVHIKIDASLGRQGVLISEIENVIAKIKECKNIAVLGIYSHFANIEDTSDFSHAQKQIDVFSRAVSIFKENGFENLETHMSASSGIMVWESDKGSSSLIRPGISIYGMWPSEDLKNRYEKSIELKPVIKWVTHIAQVKTVPENYSIGYGLTYVTDKPTKIAVIPQGYSDGYDRGLSSLGEVLIKGQRCRILGRVAMNMFVVDVTHLENIQAEEEVVLLGCQGNEQITAEEIAEKIGTINYEITTRISPLLPKIIA
jgi:alanine racemase